MGRKPTVRDEDRKFYVEGVEHLVEYMTLTNARFMDWIVSVSGTTRDGPPGRSVAATIELARASALSTTAADRQAPMQKTPPVQKTVHLWHVSQLTTFRDICWSIPEHTGTS
jgi:hypothetical protein